MEKQLKQLKMAQLRAELSEKKASIAKARWIAEASYATRITEVHDPKSQEVAISERNRELARCESHEQTAVAEYHKAVAALMAETEKGDITDTVINFDGTQTSAMLAAMAILKDAPKIPDGCSFDVSVMSSGNRYSVHALAYNRNNGIGKTCHQLTMLDIYNKKEQVENYNQWRKAVDFHFAQGKEGDNEQ